MESGLSIRGMKFVCALGLSFAVGSALSACAADNSSESGTPEEPSSQVSSSVTPGCCNGPASEPATNGLRLTVQANVAVPTLNTGVSSIYVAPYRSSSIGLYDGSAWISRIADPLPSIAVAASPASTNYDVYAYWDGTAVKLEIAAWQSPKTRLNGVYTRTGDSSRRFLGSVGVSTSGTVLDTPTNRLVWNQDNQVQRPISAPSVTTGWYVAGTSAWHDLSNSASARIEVLAGGADTNGTFVSVRADDSCVVSSPTTAVGFFATGIGVDSSNSPTSTMNIDGYTNNALYTTSTSYPYGNLAVGRHTLRWLEVGYNGITFYCYGAAIDPPFGRNNMSGTVTL